MLLMPHEYLIAFGFRLKAKRARKCFPPSWGIRYSFIRLERNQQSAFLARFVRHRLKN